MTNTNYSRIDTPGLSFGLKMREKYCLLLAFSSFMIFGFGAFFFLPSNDLRSLSSSSASSSALMFQRHVQEPLAAVLLPPPILEDSEENDRRVLPLPPGILAANSTGFAAKKRYSRISDAKKLADKINAELKDHSFVVDKRHHDHDFLNESLAQVLAPPSSLSNKHQNDQPIRGEVRDGVRTTYDSEENTRRRNTVKEMMSHAWSNYVTYAFGANELRPLTLQGHSPGIFGANTKLGASIVDAADTLFIMGMKDEFEKARSWIRDELSLEDNINADISVFEFNIRFIGGLLSAHALTNDSMFLQKALSFADKLLPAFDTPTGIPYALINPSTGYVKNYAWASGSCSILSEVGSLHLEFYRLTQVTGNNVYRQKVEKIRDVLNSAPKVNEGLYPNYINPKTASWGQHHVSLGALGDSFYEYLLKSHIQARDDKRALDMYSQAMDAVDAKLIQVSRQSSLTYLADLQYDRLVHKMDHLACFAGGLFALGANYVEADKRERHMNIAIALTNTCHESYIRTATGIGPESFRFSDQSEAVALRQNDKYYILRPEVVESYFILWRQTHDAKYREWAWQVVLALNAHCRVEHGFCGLKNVYDPNSPKDDVQQSFLFAELFKYLFLIFSDDDVIDLKKWVFNTEAHPLPIVVD